jgi:phenylpropionate dioxygenase-like ring-hydroxylating dioxygenase large terminal subunit
MRAKSSSNEVRPPAAEAFPAYPASWYLFCEGSQLKDKPFSQHILGRQLVAYRRASGQVAVMDANCAHLGANLGCGTVVGESIQCPFHHWRYGADGVCTSIPHAAQIPAFARLQTYPVTERHGSVFFFNGPEPLFSLPFFFGADPGDFAAGRAFRYVADCTWYMTAANAFDMQHFLCVHGRELIDRCQVDCPARFARRNRYRAAIVGRSRSDGFLRTFAGPTVDVSITCWGGTYMLMTADFKRGHSCFLIATRPLEDGKTLCEGVVFTRRTHNPLVRCLWQPLSLMVRRWLTYQFVADESRNLLGIRYNPATLIKSDGTMADFFRWLAQLPAHRQDVLQQEVSVPAQIARAANFG